MRVPQVGPVSGWTQRQLAVEAARACLRVVPGTDAHTKGVTGVTCSNDVAGRWKRFHLPAPIFGGELRSEQPSRGRERFSEGGCN